MSAKALAAMIVVFHGLLLPSDEIPAARNETVVDSPAAEKHNSAGCEHNCVIALNAGEIGLDQRPQFRASPRAFCRTTTQSRAPPDAAACRARRRSQAARACAASTAASQRRIDKIGNNGCRQSRDVESERGLSVHAERRGVDQEPHRRARRHDRPRTDLHARAEVSPTLAARATVRLTRQCARRRAPSRP